ncbi:acyl transferase/acyl hydrolase/lysophospholipase [Trichophaea hybrida]|nr:acyl transferase/acyl hydrolase/lysophospholipase [Trichophaea hybrida]
MSTTPELKPTPNTLRLLSIDGGGMKGYTALIILKRIMRTMQVEGGFEEEPHPCEVIDLIGGTSTGGLIAVMLGRLKMSVDDCIKKYEELGQEIFAKKPKGGKLGKFAIGMSASTLYTTESLQKAIQTVIESREDILTNGLFLDASESLCRTLLCVTRVSTSKPEVLRNYKTLHPTEENYECTIWEAALATAAAPMFFKPARFQKSGDTFCDGGLKRNNPINERIRGWKDPVAREIGCILSLGTRTPNFVKVDPRLDKLLQACVKMMTDSNDIAELFTKSKFGRELAESNRYFRFSVPQGIGDIQLDDWQATSEMRDITLEYLKKFGSGREVERCAKSLLKPDANLSLGL